jgi:hypothetical protein
MERKWAGPTPATRILAAALVAASGVALRAADLRQQSGPYAVTLQLPQAGLFAGEEMEIEFKVEKADGTPLPWGRIRGVVDMPSMPSMPRFDEIAHREGIPGVFGVHPTFPHGGDYRLCLTVLPPEVQPVGDPRPTESFTFEYPLTVWDSAASPTRESRKVKPFALDVVATPRRPAAGEPVELELRVRMATSLELREVTDFDLQHERLMHLFVVSEDLSDFAHEHPEPAGPGLFRLTHRFARPGRYRLFADVAPKDAGAQVLDATLIVGPPAAGSAPVAPAAAERRAPSTRVALTLPEGGLVAGRTLVVNALLTDEKGRPVRDLEPWLGAIGHLLLVTRDGETFAHSHPDDREPGVGKDGRIPFLVRLPRAGPYKGWLQFQRRGKVETLEVALDAAPYSAAR